MPKTWGLTKQLGALDDGRVLLLVSEENKVSYPRRVFLVFYNPNTKTFTKFMDTASDILVLYTGSLLS
jgi:hypothetical protein